MSNDLVIINFAQAERPKYTEAKGEGKGYQNFGSDNKYPEYLMKLFDGSAKHNAIVKGKTVYVVGNGWAQDGTSDAKTTQFIEQVNPFESLNDLTRKGQLDKSLFGGAYFQICWDKAGNRIAAIYHLGYNRVRTNKDNTQFWVSEDWAIRKNIPEVYQAFNPENPSGTQILYIREYRPGGGAYALPDYYGALNYIAADVEVGEHVLGNAQTGFTASKMISLFDGEPKEEQKKAIERKFTNRFTGADGKKFILSFPKTIDHAPRIDDLGASDLTKEDFSSVDNLIQSNIFSGHQCTTPELFGISTPGKLGGTNTLRDGYQIFNNTYVKDQQMQLESAFNMLLKYYGGTGKLQLQKTNPIGIDIKGDVLAKTAPKSWLYEQLAIDPIKYPDGPALVENTQPTSTSTVQVQQRQQFSDDDAIVIFSEFGISRSEYSIVKSRKVRFNSDEDMLADEMDNASLHLEFAEKELSKLESSILSLITKDKRITAEVIAEALGEPVGHVVSAMSRLEKAGKIASSTDARGVVSRDLTKPLDELTKKVPKKLTTMQIRYSYDGPKDDKNRAFCAKLMDLDRLYSRQDIESISARLGYSVFDRRGGWYTIPGTNEHRPYCRHWWTSQIVIKND